MKALQICAALAAGCAAGPAFAQQDPIETCRKQSATDAARIACLEETVRMLLGTPLQASGEPASVASKETAPQDTSVAQLDPAPSAEPTGMGAEQVKRRQIEKGERNRDEDKAEPVGAVVTEFAYTSLGNVIFFLDNGQIWRQKDADASSIRLSKKRRYSVVISEGMLSGYRLTINELKKTLLVERLK